jgi:trans-aconitate methyltransferase
MNPSLSSTRRKFLNAPVSHNTLNPNRDYSHLGAEVLAYNTYRHYIKSHIKNPKNEKVIDVNCAYGYGLASLKDEFGFKKCIGFNSNPEHLSKCKSTHDGISFYKDFIMSKQGDANFVLAFDVLDLYVNKSALLLKLAHVLADDGILVLVNRISDPFEYKNFEMILEKTHGLTKLMSEDISDSVRNAVDEILGAQI